jgi:hypothetical protein
MSSLAKALPFLSEKTHFDPARVIEDERDDGTVQVKLDKTSPGSIMTAQVALARTQPLAAGIRVLVAGDSSRELYVIGALDPARPEPQTPAVLRACNGAFALYSADPEKKSGVLQVFSPRKELVFEYDPAGEKARVHIARGCLELSTEDGDIELRSARNVKISGHAIELNSQELNVKASSARWIIDRIETLAETMIEKARNVYRTVEQLSQLKTGRMRTLVEQTFQFKSRRAFLKSEEDFKIKGEKIHLG